MILVSIEFNLIFGFLVVKGVSDDEGVCIKFKFFIVFSVNSVILRFIVQMGY
jgi:hypothetical protein